MTKKKAKPPVVRTYRIMEEAIEEGLRGFLFNDVEDPHIPETKIDSYVDYALNRIMIALDERFEL